jgi:pimeloyl-ACP methyl ester carboxylesterase
MKKHLLYDGKKITYHIYGSGKPVFLVHGFGEDGTVWNNQVDSLKSKFKLIVPDLPGSGNSEIVDDMSVEGMAEVIHAIIHEEDLDKATILGHSMGGYITLALAEKYGNHVDGFGLIHSTAFADSEEKKATRRKGIEFILKNGAFEFLKTATPNLFSEEFKDKQPSFIGEYISRLDNFLPGALVKYYKAMIQAAGPDNHFKKGNRTCTIYNG